MCGVHHGMDVKADGADINLVAESHVALYATSVRGVVPCTELHTSPSCLPEH